MKNSIIFILFISIFASCAKKPASTVMEKKKKDAIVVIHSEQGDIHLVLFDDTPKHKESFLKLASL